MSTDLNLSLQNATLSKIASNFMTKQRMINHIGGEKKEPLEKNVSDVAIVRAPYNKLLHGAVSTVPESAFV